MMGNETSDLTDLNSIDSDDTGSTGSNRPTSPSIFGTHEERNVNPDNNQPSTKNIETIKEGSCSALKERLTETAQREPKDNGFVTTEPDENSNTNKFVAVIAELKGKQLSVKSPPPVHPKPNPTICTVDRKCSGQILQTQTRLCTNSENVVNTSFLLKDENNTVSISNFHFQVFHDRFNSQSGSTSDSAVFTSYFAIFRDQTHNKYHAYLFTRFWL